MTDRAVSRAFEAAMGPSVAGGGAQTVLEAKPRTKSKRPDNFDVLMLNDDFTTVEFVKAALRRHFQKSEAEASEITQRVHTTGIALAGTYSREVAEGKACLVMEEARRREFPFLLIVQRHG